jgi:hypothetical protein
MVILAVVLPTLLGAMALCVDVSMFYFNWANLQKAADSAALAGAHYLPNKTDQAASVATSYAGLNGVAGGEIQSITFAAANTQITVTLSRQVPFYFGKVLGLSDAPVTVAATAAIVDAVTLDNPIPVGLQRCLGNPVGCYNPGSPMTLKPPAKFIVPGNWGLVDYPPLGGGADIRDELAHGCQCSVALDEMVSVDTEPGKKIGPVMQGLQARLDAAAANFPTEFDAATASPENPRVVAVPVVDFTGVRGAKEIPVLGFAVMFISSVDGGGGIRATFLKMVVPGTPGSKDDDELAKAPKLIQ